MTATGSLGLRIFAEPASQPPLENRPEREVRLHGFEDFCPGIDVCLYGVAAEQRMAEAVNRGGGEFVKAKAALFERRFLRRRQAVR